MFIGRYGYTGPGGGLSTDKLHKKSSEKNRIYFYAKVVREMLMVSQYEDALNYICSLRKGNIISEETSEQFLNMMIAEGSV